MNEEAAEQAMSCNTTLVVQMSPCDLKPRLSRIAAAAAAVAAAGRRWRSLCVWCSSSQLFRGGRRPDGGPDRGTCRASRLAFGSQPFSLLWDASSVQSSGSAAAAAAGLSPAEQAAAAGTAVSWLPEGCLSRSCELHIFCSLQDRSSAVADSCA